MKKDNTQHTPGPLEILAGKPREGFRHYCEMCGKSNATALLEPAFNPDSKAQILCRACRMGSAELLDEQRRASSHVVFDVLLGTTAQLQAALDALYVITGHLLETHMDADEYSGHGGDADHDGEAPEACSYCREIQKAREILKAAGRDVTAITPEVQP